MPEIVAPAPLAVEDILDKALAEEELSAEEGYRLILSPDDALPALMAAASTLRDRHKGKTVTYSRKVFLPVTNLCRDRCSYCTFRKDPGDPGAWTMTPAEILDWSHRGRATGCKEALMCLGDKPEKAFRQYRETLRVLGHATTVEYVYRACEIALAQGLLPHTNAGIMTYAEMASLKETNVSMGLMLENVSPRLRKKGLPHYYAPDKDPGVRLRMLREAGELQIPFTTGILVGIGETLEEQVDSLIAIREIHRTYGHIQEVIVQNFREKPDIPMAGFPEPDGLEMAKTLAVSRLLLGGEMNIQAPPNLSPNEHQLFLQAGINDWGGISPVTQDYINPEAPWPHIAALAETCREAGFTLSERLAIYPEYIERPGFLHPALHTPTQTLQQQISSS
jgi:7,8-didemethyl-8-hydroxy-5-deazariboflavin synthase CofG subunit